MVRYKLDWLRQQLGLPSRVFRHTWLEHDIYVAAADRVPLLVENFAGRVAREI